ncbi:hypothetical protein [Xenorhabdus bovienii]|uniref:Uncharacterized protein n=1 Tax=Xenorhabdus bovienii str. kraussei Becker Underwood TaxID=1398204 RepID=A0A077PS31_XENBV|nr:hypothetical protein [Xenorhabdus bovienii]CDH22654.1 conserved membrane hypothetical protein [Xenorhabdus bovienii str. kraussei Becker Underwood]
MEKFLTATSTFIEKATDTRYFLLFASFLILTDTVLCKTINTPLLQFTYSDVANKLQLGATLIYMSFFLFYISVFVPLTAYTLGLLLNLLPPKCLSIFHNVNEGKYKKDGYISIYELKNEAISENNSVKLNICIKQENKNNDELRLYQLSFTFLFTSILSFFITFNNQGSILNMAFNFFNYSDDFIQPIILLIMIILIIYCIALGIGGYCLNRYTSRYIYLINKNVRGG